MFVQIQQFFVIKGHAICNNAPSVIDYYYYFITFPFVSLFNSSPDIKGNSIKNQKCYE